MKHKVFSLINIINDYLDTNRTVFICGNGGSAHNAEHYQTDWQKMIFLNTNKKLKIQVLTLNTGLISAYSNDIDFNSIFTEQLKVHTSENDLLITISGSGNSQNLINAVDFANDFNVNTFGILGYDGGKLISKCNSSILVPSFDMQICEDIHLMICHIVMKALGNFKLIT